MKKLAIVIIIILSISGCAHQQKPAYVIPQFIKDRPVLSIYQKTHRCLKLSEDGQSSRLLIHPNKKVNAWIDDQNRVYLTEGIFNYDDGAITFIIAHELSHAKLKHIRSRKAVSYATTGVMMVVGSIIPGAGLLNWAVNPAVTNNFGKTQELDADRLASETLVKCFDISIERQIHILESLQKDAAVAGGFWSTHPSFNDRIENIRQLPR